MVFHLRAPVGFMLLKCSIFLNSSNWLICTEAIEQGSIMSLRKRWRGCCNCFFLFLLACSFAWSQLLSSPLFSISAYQSPNTIISMVLPATAPPFDAPQPSAYNRECVNTSETNGHRDHMLVNEMMYPDAWLRRAAAWNPVDTTPVIYRADL